ncbi:hypothetical protein V8E53_005833 [Lactarius tabidus]
MSRSQLTHLSRVILALCSIWPILLDMLPFFGTSSVSKVIGRYSPSIWCSSKKRFANVNRLCARRGLLPYLDYLVKQTLEADAVRAQSVSTYLEPTCLSICPTILVLPHPSLRGTNPRNTALTI